MAETHLKFCKNGTASFDLNSFHYSSIQHSCFCSFENLIVSMGSSSPPTKGQVSAYRVLHPVCDVINSEINLSFFDQAIFLHTQKVSTKI